MSLCSAAAPHLRVSLGRVGTALFLLSEPRPARAPRWPRPRRGSGPAARRRGCTSYPAPAERQPRAAARAPCGRRPGAAPAFPPGARGAPPPRAASAAGGRGLAAAEAGDAAALDAALDARRGAGGSARPAVAAAAAAGEWPGGLRASLAAPSGHWSRGRR